MPKKSAASSSSLRVATGIPGLDHAIEQGFKRNRVTLVSGDAGSGKTIFAMQYILNGITKYGEPGLYISFEESREHVFDDMRRFGWDLAKLEKEGNFAFVEHTPEQVGKVLKTGGGVIRDLVEKLGAKRLVIDSISAFTLLQHDELEKREAILALFRLMRKWNCTTLITGQHSPIDKRVESAAESFGSDNIIYLHNIKKEQERVRALEVFKMRGTKHSTKTFLMRITGKGIQIYPEETIF